MKPNLIVMAKQLHQMKFRKMITKSDTCLYLFLIILMSSPLRAYLNTLMLSKKSAT